MSRAWMPLYIGDFLADTMHLGATERGIYISLIMHCWQHGTIPRDDRKLARISGCDSRLWHLYQGTVLQFFDIVDGSTMQHRRVTTELHRYAEISNKRKASALQMHSKSSAFAEQLHTQSQSPSPIEKKPKKVSSPKQALPPDWSLPEEGRAYARSKEWSEAKIETEAERFRDHALSHGRRQIDWPAAWRSWVNSPLQKRGINGSTASPPRPGSRDDVRERNANAYRALCDFVDANADDKGGSGRSGEAAFGILPGFERPRS